MFMYSLEYCSLRSEFLRVTARSLVFSVFSRGIDRRKRRTRRREGGTFLCLVCIHVGRSVSCGREVLAPLHLTLHLTLHAVAHHPVRVVVLVAAIGAGNLLDGLRADALSC